MDMLEEQFLKYPLDFIAHFLLLLPIAVGVYRRERLTNTLVAVIVYFLIIFVQEVVLLVYTLNKVSSIRLQQLLLIIDSLITAEIYYLAFKYKTSYRQIVVVSLAISLTILIINYLAIPLAFISSSVHKLTIILFSLMYFNKVLLENRVKNMINHAMFWISAGFLLFGMGTFFSSLFIDYLLGDSNELDIAFDLFWGLDQVIICIQCILAAIGFWVSRYDRANYLQPV